MKRYWVTMVAVPVLLNMACGPREVSQADLPREAPRCGFPAATELERFLDGFIPGEMARLDVPGALIVAVQGDEILLAKGYGYSDLNGKSPVSPDGTIVRAYSVSKPFTAVAAMQMVEAGTLELQRDVNDYLEDFRVDSGEHGIVTTADLMTHISGFNDEDGSLLALGPYREYSLAQWLEAAMPPRLWNPNEKKMEYSNWGFSLVGHIVELRSGQPYAEYMQEHVLAPLGMNRSSFLWPSELPDDERKAVAPGYRPSDSGGIRQMTETEGDFANTPAANLLTTGHDIARFMIAQLNGGELNGKRLLSQANTALMHEPWKSTDSPENTGYGFFWRDSNGLRELFHAGGWYGAVSDMELIPAYDSAYFTWYNHGDDADRTLRATIGSRIKDAFFVPCIEEQPQ